MRHLLTRAAHARRHKTQIGRIALEHECQGRSRDRNFLCTIKRCWSFFFSQTPGLELGACNREMKKTEKICLGRLEIVILLHKLGLVLGAHNCDRVHVKQAADLRGIHTFIVSGHTQTPTLHAPTGMSTPAAPAYTNSMRVETSSQLVGRSHATKKKSLPVRRSHPRHQRPSAPARSSPPPPRPGPSARTRL